MYAYVGHHVPHPIEVTPSADWDEQPKQQHEDEPVLLIPARPAADEASP